MKYARVTQDNWRDVSLRLSRNIELGVRDVAASTEEQIKGYITHPPGGPSPTARADGRAGLRDTSNYIRSWNFKMTSDTQAEVGSPVEYGPYLEYGHMARRSRLREGPARFVPAYPHIVPAANKIRDRVAEFFRGLDR